MAGEKSHKYRLFTSMLISILVSFFNAIVYYFLKDKYYIIPSPSNSQFHLSILSTFGSKEHTGLRHCDQDLTAQGTVIKGKKYEMTSKCRF